MIYLKNTNTMKKTIGTLVFSCLCLGLLGSCNKIRKIVTLLGEEDKKETIYVQNKPDTLVVVHKDKEQDALHTTYIGKIGDDDSAVLSLNGDAGWYSYYNGKVKRNIEVVNYDRSSGYIELYAYATKSADYIGRFDGTIKNKNIKGTFTNYKGVQVKFNMSATE